MEDCIHIYTPVNFLKIKKKFKQKRILVIGGLGYIGSVVVSFLLKKKYKINILDINFYGSYLDKKIKNNKNLKIFYGDCNDKKKTKNSH